MTPLVSVAVASVGCGHRMNQYCVGERQPDAMAFGNGAREIIELEASP